MSKFSFIFVLLLATQVSAQDDTAKIQAEMDKGGDVVLSSGTFVCKPLKWPAKLNDLSGGPVEAPTTLVLAPNSGAWAHFLEIKHGGNTDRKVGIRNLRIDLNRSNQGWDGKWNLEHVAGIFGTCEKTQPAKLYLDIDNVRIYNSPGDGVYTHHRTVTNAHKLFLTDCFRAGFAVTGREASATARDSKWVNCGIDAEPNSDGHTVNIRLDNVEMDKFDVYLSAGSKFYGTDITYNGTNFYLWCHPTAEYYLADSTLLNVPGSKRLKVRLAGTTTFQRCKAYGFTGASNIFNVVWDEVAGDATSAKTDQTFTLKDCILQGPAALGVDLGIDPGNRRNLFVSEGTQYNDVTKPFAPQKNPGVGKKVIDSYFNGVKIP